jgi:hypothetical protein
MNPDGSPVFGPKILDFATGFSFAVSIGGSTNDECLPATYEDLDNGRYLVNFTVRAGSDVNIFVFFDNKPIPGLLLLGHPILSSPLIWFCQARHIALLSHLLFRLPLGFALLEVV